MFPGIGIAVILACDAFAFTSTDCNSDVGELMNKAGNI